MSELGFGNQSDFELKVGSLGPLLVGFLLEIWSDKSLILKFLGLNVYLAALNMRQLKKKGAQTKNFNKQICMALGSIKTNFVFSPNF